jgi:histidinol dehydrogenase
MLAQAEHDPMAAAICIAVDRRTAELVCAEVAAQLETLERRSIARSSIRAWGTVLVVENLQRAAELANRIAPEHLEVLVRNPRRMVPDLHNAGAIFLGPYSAESLGDYAAGPNHVLPTGGAARFSSPLGVYDFIKRTSIIEATRAGFDRLAPTVERLARSEGLEGHALAVTRRTGAGGS